MLRRLFLISFAALFVIPTACVMDGDRDIETMGYFTCKRDTDCGDHGGYCLEESLVSVCDNHEQCSTKAASGKIDARRNLCVDHRCAECESSVDCLHKTLCKDRKCGSCSGDADCTTLAGEGKVESYQTTCSDGFCGECTANTDCTALITAGKIDGARTLCLGNLCVACDSPASCAQARFGCLGGLCAECSSDKDCLRLVDQGLVDAGDTQCVNRQCQSAPGSEFAYCAAECTPNSKSGAIEGVDTATPNKDCQKIAASDPLRALMEPTRVLCKNYVCARPDCKSNSDCLPYGGICQSENGGDAKTCQEQCLDDLLCTELAKSEAVGANQVYCRNYACVECSTSTDCKAQITANKLDATKQFCKDSKCIECTSDADCRSLVESKLVDPARLQCKEGSCSFIACTVDDHCKSTTQGSCIKGSGEEGWRCAVQCELNSDCVDRIKEGTVPTGFTLCEKYLCVAPAVDGDGESESESEGESR